MLFPPKATVPLKSALKVQLTKATAPCSTSMVQDIMALQQAHPNSFDVIGNMSGTYANRTNPKVLPVQHARCKNQFKYMEQIECTVDEMVGKGVIVPVSWPMMGIFANISLQT